MFGSALTRSAQSTTNHLKSHPADIYFCKANHRKVPIVARSISARPVPSNVRVNTIEFRPTLSLRFPPIAFRKLEFAAYDTRRLSMRLFLATNNRAANCAKSFELLSGVFQ